MRGERGREYQNEQKDEKGGERTQKSNINNKKRKEGNSGVIKGKSKIGDKKEKVGHHK